MQPHQESLVKEKAELDEKIANLEAFQQGDIHRTLPEIERARLKRQFWHMKDYSDVLGERIAAFEGVPYGQVGSVR